MNNYSLYDIYDLICAAFLLFIGFVFLFLAQVLESWLDNTDSL